MWMTQYIQEIQKKFITDYGFAEDLLHQGVPLGVSDGEYPMEINGKLDTVRIENGKIFCCNFSDRKAA